jgi:hypothetical protein
MNEREQLEKFSEDLIQEVISAADSDEIGEFRTDQFTRTAAEFLIEAGEIEDINVCYFKARGMQFNGYNISQEEDCLDLFISIFNQNTPPPSVTKTQCETVFRQAETCLRKALTGHHTSLEEASEAYDAFQRIYEVRTQLTNCRIYLLTDGIVSQEVFSTIDVGDITITLNVWDIRRIYRFVTSGMKFEPIEIDFETDYGCLIPCLSLVDPNSDYKGYLAVIPGAILSGVYDRYGPRLLERNVRSFLQARGKVNKGIRNTILQEPHRFFAYNNGITATADFIEFEEKTDGLKIRKVRNLQIVNGGQTTASLFHTAKKDKADLSGIFVQAKLSVIPHDHVEEIVPLISKFANSQNKVSEADFYANDPFHVSIEEFSRTVWAPTVDGSSRTTRWFYERARGQYMDAKAREMTPARKRQFEAQNPNRQKFNKTDLAKYENTWMQLPHVVSLGAQKNFNDFSVRLKERGRGTVDIKYFEHLISKAILFKKADKIVRDRNYGGYKANIVTYTVAWLAHYTSQRIDLDRIWQRQDVTPALEDAIGKVSEVVQQIITSPPKNRNVTEWCKRKECWDLVRETAIDIGATIDRELIDVGQVANRKPDKGLEGPDENELIQMTLVTDVPAEKWFQISKWAKETNNLQGWQRGIAYSIGKAIGRTGTVSLKQAKQGAIILEEAEKLGFRIEHNKFE